MIYFIRAEGTNEVKVGYSKSSALTRLKRLQTGCSKKLVLEAVAHGDRREEQRLHRELADERLQGEWFTLSPRRVGTLARVVSAPPEKPLEGPVIDRFEEYRIKFVASSIMDAAIQKTVAAELETDVLPGDYFRRRYGFECLARAALIADKAAKAAYAVYTKRLREDWRRYREDLVHYEHGLRESMLPLANPDT